MGGMCGACIDVTGDPACVAAYGAGYLCLDGACVKAQCRVAADCGDAGKTCADGTCVSSGCHSDGDCTDAAKPVCDLSNNSCVSATAACTGKNAGDSCAGTNSKHLCCGATLSCEAIDCCTNAQCPAGQTCSAQNACANPSCPVVSDHVYYVDANDPGTNGRTGSSTCPFKSLTQALSFVTNPANAENAAYNVTITIRSPISESNEGVGAFPIYIPSRVLVQGASDAPRPAVTVPDGATGFIFNYPKPPASQAFGGMSQLLITQATAVTDDAKQGNGIQVSGTHDIGDPLTTSLNIDISRVTIEKFRHAIHVDTGGYVGLGGGISITGDYIGLYVTNGYVHALVSAQSPSHYDDNFFAGMYVGGASILNVDGAPAADAGTGKALTADRNNYGVRFLSYGAIPTGLTSQLLDVEMNNNSKADPTTATTSGAGLFAYAGGNGIKVRNSVFANNYNGVRVAADSSAMNPNHVQAIDLGTNGTSGAGNNIFSGAKTLLCISTVTGPNFENVNGPLNVAGNTWGTKACTGGAPTSKLTALGTCDSTTDVGFTQTINKDAAMINATCAFQ
jgi:hypothetical protein